MLDERASRGRHVTVEAVGTATLLAAPHSKAVPDVLAECG
jgi:hypothetical protein